jgi:hypothetical protein
MLTIESEPSDYQDFATSQITRVGFGVDKSTVIGTQVDKYEIPTIWQKVTCGRNPNNEIPR